MAHRSHDPGVRDRQKGDASSGSTDTSFLRFGGERRSMGAPFLVSRRSLRSVALLRSWPSGERRGNGNIGGVSWSPTPTWISRSDVDKRGPGSLVWTRGDIHGSRAYGAHTHVSRRAREGNRGSRLVESVRSSGGARLHASSQSFESFMMPHHPIADLSKRRSGCKWRIAGFFAGISSDQTP